MATDESDNSGLRDAPQDKRSRWIRWCIAILLATGTWIAFRDRLFVHPESGSLLRPVSYAFLIPFAAVWLAWKRRQRLSSAIFRCSRFGFAALGLGAGLHVIAVNSHSQTVDVAAFVTVLCGIVLSVWGRYVFVVMWPVVLFCAFMVSMPDAIAGMFAASMQRAAATDAAYYIQVFGTAAVPRINKILTPAAVLDLQLVLPGLEVLVIYLATSVALAIASDRRHTERFLLACSAVPVAAVLSIAAIVQTAVAVNSTGSQINTVVVPPPDLLVVVSITVVTLLAGFRVLDWLFTEMKEQIPEISRHSLTQDLVSVKAQPPAL